MAKKPLQKNLHLKYTICFPRVGDKVLMVYRYREPNKDLWNGLGGKLEPGETPRQSVFREMLEEAEMDLNKALDVHFSGIVTWNKSDDPDLRVGMYSFVVDLPGDYQIWEREKETPEGLLGWKDQNWPSNISNIEVVSNIPHFLPPMLIKDKPVEYYFNYDGHKLVEHSIYSLPENISID